MALPAVGFYELESREQQLEFLLQYASALYQPCPESSLPVALVTLQDE
jgi:hypothetical protein